MSKKAGTGPSSPVPVSRVLEAGKDELRLELIAGKTGLNRRIPEAALNRPGLALSGFFEHFAHKRMQVFGLGEYAYLESLDDETRQKRVCDFFGHKIPCVVIARGKRAFPEMKACADELGIPILRTKMITRHFINAATIVMENLMAPRMNVQGTMVEIMGVGVLIEGKPGVGKSETALGLIKRGAALVSDDITALRVDSAGAIMGSPVNVTRYHMEIRGLGIIHVPSLFGVASVRHQKRLDLVATLVGPGAVKHEDRSRGMQDTRRLFGMSLPQVFVEVKPGRDVVNIVETAALDMKLRQLGHDAAKELDEKLMARMTGGQQGSD